MICFIQNILQKHYKWIFSFLLISIIITFSFSEFALISSSNTNDTNHYGLNLNKEKNIKNTLIDSKINFFLTKKSNVLFENQIERILLTRIALIDLLKKLKIPDPSNDSLISFIKKINYFLDKKNNFNYKRYKDFLLILKNNYAINEKLIKKTIINDYKISIVKKILEGPGYLIPYEAKIYADQLETLWSIDIAESNFDQFYFNPKISDAKIKNYYIKEKKIYFSKQKVFSSLIYFKSINYNQQIKIPNDRFLNQFFLKNIKNFFMEQGVIPTFKNSKSKVIKLYIDQESKIKAYKNAIAFADYINRKKIQRNSSKFKKLLAYYKAEIVPISPKNFHNFIKNQNLSKDLLLNYIKSNHKQFISNVFLNKNENTILVFDKINEAQEQSFNKIKNKVKSDLIKKIKFDKFYQKNNQIFDQLTKDNFIHLLKLKKLSIKSFNNFTFNKCPKEITNIIRQNIFDKSIDQIIKIINKEKFIYINIKNKYEFKNDINNLQVINLQKKIKLSSKKGNFYDFIEELIFKKN